MPFEIERKYLVKHALWNALAKPKGEYYRQGYIVNEKVKTVRVRATGKSWIYYDKRQNR